MLPELELRDNNWCNCSLFQNCAALYLYIITAMFIFDDGD